MTSNMPERIYAAIVDDTLATSETPFVLTPSVTYYRADLAQKTVTREDIEYIMSRAFIEGVVEGVLYKSSLDKMVNALIQSGVVKVSE